MVCGIGFPRLVGFGMPFQLKRYELTSWRVENPKMVSQNSPKTARCGTQALNMSWGGDVATPRWNWSGAPAGLWGMMHNFGWEVGYFGWNWSGFPLGVFILEAIWSGLFPLGCHLWKLLEGHLGTNDHPSRPGVELQEVGIKGPMDHQDQCWTLDQAHDPNRGMGPGLLKRVEKWSMNSESETWIVDEPFANFSF